MGRVAASRPRSRALALDPPSSVAALAHALPSGRSLLVGFTVLALAIGGYVGARQSSIFAVHSVEVAGCSPRVAAQVGAALAPLEGRSLMAIGGGDIDRALAGLPEVEIVGFDRRYPETLRVTVAAERPVAVARRGTDAWLVSERGRILQALPETRPRLLPRVWVAQLPAPAEGSIPSSEPLVESARALGVVLRSDREFFARIREARASAGAVALVLRSGTELRLGSPDDVALKVAVADEVLTALVGERPGYLDVSVPERPVVGQESQVSG